MLTCDVRRATCDVGRAALIPYVRPTVTLSLQFWAYYIDMMGTKICFMFALTPHVSEELYNSTIESWEEKVRSYPKARAIPNLNPRAGLYRYT